MGLLRRQAKYKVVKDEFVEQLAGLLRLAYLLGEKEASNQTGKTKENIGAYLYDAFPKATTILSHFIGTFQTWLKGFSKKPKQSEIDEFLDNLMDVTAQYEIATAVQYGMYETFEEAGVQAILWEASPDACQLCHDNAEIGKIRLGGEFPSGHTKPPVHPRCHCFLSNGDTL